MTTTMTRRWAAAFFLVAVPVAFAQQRQPEVNKNLPAEAKCPEGPDSVPWPDAKTWEPSVVDLGRKESRKERHERWLEGRRAAEQATERLVTARTMYFQSAVTTEGPPSSLLWYQQTCSAQADLLFFWREDTVVVSAGNTALNIWNIQTKGVQPQEVVVPTRHLLVLDRRSREVLFNSKGVTERDVWEGNTTFDVWKVFYERVREGEERLRKKREKEEKKK